MAITPLFPTDSGPQPGSMGVVRGGTVAGRTVGGACVVAIPSVEHLPTLADDRLLDLFGELDEAARAVAAARARVAGEISRRSAFAAGHTGLAARLGERTPEKLIQRLTGVSAGEAKELTAAGAVLRDADDGAMPWLEAAATAVTDGGLSIAGAAAVAKGLGEPTGSVSEASLTEVTEQLVEFAKTATPEETVARGRAVRDAIDTTGVADRERKLRGLRSFTTRVLPNGITRAIVDLDPESAAIVVGAVRLWARVAKTKNEITFMTAEERDAEAIRIAEGADGVTVRTTAQADLDGLVDIVQLAARASTSDLDPERIFGEQTPGIRVHVQAADLAAGPEAATSVGYIEGQTASVSIETVTRLICTSGILPVLFKGLKPIDAGRTQRLHSVRQRIAAAAAWGGCAWNGCDQPEHACEMHHPEQWNGSNTTLVNSIPLCRFHHVELHDNGWTLSVDLDGTVWLDPPPSNTVAKRRPLIPKTPFHRVAS